VGCIKAEVEVLLEQQNKLHGFYGACIVEENFLRDFRLKLTDGAQNAVRIENGNPQYDIHSVILNLMERNYGKLNHDRKFLKIINELVAEPATGLENEAKEAFARGLTNLAAEKQQQAAQSELERLRTHFIKSWSSRVAREVRVYIEGLRSLVKSPLHDDCMALLFDYLVALIPKLLRAAKNDVHKDGGSGVPSDLDERVEALEKQVKSAGSLDSLLAHLRSFDRSLKIATPDTSASNETKQSRLRELCETLQKDENGPRLFLSLVVILWSTAPGVQGIVYITGKFSPRLLRLLAERADQGELGEDDTKRMQAATLLKDKVKRETLEDSDVRWIRQAAKEAVELWEQRQMSSLNLTPLQDDNEQSANIA